MLIDSAEPATAPPPTWGTRWAAVVVRRPKAILLAWLVVIIAGGIGYSIVGAQLPPADVSVFDSDSAAAARLTTAQFGAFGTEQDLIVFDSPTRTVTDPEYRAVVDRALATARDAAGTQAVIGPFDPFNPFGARAVSEDRHAAIAMVTLSDRSPNERAQATADLQSVLRDSSGADVSVALTGYSPSTNDLARTEQADTARVEVIGLPIALIVLALTFGALVAAGLPLIVAGAGLLGAFGLIAVLMPLLNFSGLIVTIATVLGTGIGIDYSLFIVSRFREELARRATADPATRIADALGTTLATAGRTIAISGVIVMITLSALLLINSPVFREITFGVSVTVLALLAVALIALPALLVLLGERVNRLPLPHWARPHDAAAETVGTQGRWAAWTRRVLRRPLRYGLLGAGVLIAATIPVADLKTGFDLGSAALTDTDSGHANTVLAEQFSPGLLGPLQIVATGPGERPLGAAERAAAQAYTAEVARDPRITLAFTQFANGSLLQVAVPTMRVDSSEAIDLVRDLRARVPQGADTPEIVIGGPTAQFLDLANETETKTPWVIGAVLLLTFLFLGAAFRSVVLPLKAILLNLLVTGASVGITVAVFQWGHGAGLLDFESVGFLQIYVPITVFCVLFGLSMDYEVFLLGRIREAWLHADPALPPRQRNDEAVVEGVEHTARPITAAAAVMMAILFSMLAADVLELKQFGLSIGLAIAIDALLVRLVLVPAAMSIAGRWNWWPGAR